MKCTNDCNQGRNCTCMPITMDEPPVTFDQIVGWIRNALAGVGIGALCAIVGFWSAR